MLLAINAGNTSVSLGVVRDGAIVGARRAATRASATPDELELLFDGLLRLDGRSLAEAHGLVVASVVPALSASLVSVAGRRALTLLEASAATIPIPVRIDRPEEVGADRLVNALAVQRLYGRPAIVVDIGTATTFDVVDVDGAYVGGAIAPGLQMSVDALAQRTARLPHIELRQPERAIGRSTVEAMQSGAIFGYLGLTQELLRRIGAELRGAGAERAVHVVATGGLSRMAWLAGLEGVERIDPDLTLKGLAILAAERGQPA